jgi:hypothetical protein
MTLDVRRSRPLALLTAVAFALTMATSVAAYGPQVPTLITVTPSSLTFLCGHPEAVEATVLDQDGLPIKQATVTWSFTSSPSSNDRYLQGTSKTNKDGVARSMVKLACVAGDRVLTATTGGISGSAVVHVDLGHPGKGAAKTAQSGAAANTTSRGVSMEKTSAVVNTGIDPLPGDVGRLGFVLLFMLIAALIVVRRLVLPRR